MARNDGVDRTVVRNRNLTERQIGDAEKHNERQKDCYSNPDIVPERTCMNIHFKDPEGNYSDTFQQMVDSGQISTRGLKGDACHYGELVFDVNTAYFHNHGGYEFAKQYYKAAYEAAVEIVGGEQYILSAVMHADERNAGMSEQLGYDVWHYHLHVVYIPVVEKQILWSKRCKDSELIGKVKETVMQVSSSKKWQSEQAVDENGIPKLSRTGKPVLLKSYRILQDRYHEHMVNAGFTDVERGERGSTEEHLSVLQFKVNREKENLAALEEEKAKAESDLEQLNAQKEQTDREFRQAKASVSEWNTRVQDAEKYASSLGEPEDLMSKPDALESAKAYRKRVAIPIVSRLISVIRDLYLMLQQERKRRQQLQTAYDRDTRIWKDRAEIADEVKDKASRFDRLSKVIGAERISLIHGVD